MNNEDEGAEQRMEEETPADAEEDDERRFDDEEREISSSDDDENDYRAARYEEKELDFDFKGFLGKYLHSKIVSHYGWAFKDWATLTPLTFHCILKMFHRIVFQLDFPPLICQLSIFKVFQAILRVPVPMSHLKEGIQFFYHLWPKFVKLCEKNNKMFVEVLFWKSTGDAMEIQEGYGTLTAKKTADRKKKVNPKFNWTEVEDNELEILAEEYLKLPREERKHQNIVNWINSRFTSGGKVKKLMKAKLEEKGYMEKLKELRKSTKKPKGEGKRKRRRKNRGGQVEEEDGERPEGDGEGRNVNGLEHEGHGEGTSRTSNGSSGSSSSSSSSSSDNDSDDDDNEGSDSRRGSSKRTAVSSDDSDDSAMFTKLRNRFGDLESAGTTDSDQTKKGTSNDGQGPTNNKSWTRNAVSSDSDDSEIMYAKLRRRFGDLEGAADDGQVNGGTSNNGHLSVPKNNDISLICNDEKDTVLVAAVESSPPSPSDTPRKSPTNTFSSEPGEVGEGRRSAGDPEDLDDKESCDVAQPPPVQGNNTSLISDDDALVIDEDTRADDDKIISDEPMSANEQISSDERNPPHVEEELGENLSGEREPDAAPVTRVDEDGGNGF